MITFCCCRALVLLRFVHWTPGARCAALAACRDQAPYLAVVGGAAPDLERKLIRDTVALTIVVELSNGQRDGFSAPRFLSRAQSLGGDPVVTPQKPEGGQTKQAVGDGQKSSASHKSACGVGHDHVGSDTMPPARQVT